MKDRIKKISKKNISVLGIFLPIFLFEIIFLFVWYFAYQPLNIILALNEEVNSKEVFARYRLSGVRKIFDSNDKVFAEIYHASVTRLSLHSLQKDSRIKYVEIDRTLKVSSITTNDPFLTSDPSDEEKQWYLPKIKLPQAWDYTTGKNDVVVAVIDTGIHAGHIELNDGRVIEGFDSIANQTIPINSNSDDNGHGTAVAGVIGAIPNNGKGIAGINWNVKLMPIKALASDGTGLASSVAQAVVWAADHGAHIINLSLGGLGFGSDQTLNNAVTYAFNKGVLIIAAVGNDSAENGINLDSSPVYPVCSDNSANMVLGVAATDTQDHKASFSNFGTKCVDITAPGKKILTTAYLPSDPSNNVLIYGSGTSLATQIVSGVAALIKSSNFFLTNVDIRNILLKTAENIDFINQTNCLNSSCSGLLGKGRINAYTALSPQPVGEGSLVRAAISGKIFLISAGTKKFVSSFVFNQRGFSQLNVTPEANNALSLFPLGPPLPPLEGTLVKGFNDPTVYIIYQEVKRPLTYLVFVSRGLSFAKVSVLADSEVADFKSGDWYWPPDETMILIKGNPTVYVLDKEVRRPVTYFVFVQRKLSFTKVISVTPDEFTHLPSPGDSFWLSPLDGTLVKSNLDPTVYVIESGTRKALSYEAFISKGYKFRSVVNLPQAEIDVIAPGTVILK